jgi:hypothetical protein
VLARKRRLSIFRAMNSSLGRGRARANIPTMARGVHLFISATLFVLLAAACGGGGRSEAAGGTANLPVLHAVPGLAAQDRALDADALSHDAPLPSLAGNLERWGFLGGREREFKGASKTFTDVVSRTLLFRGPAGARAYVAFVADHAASYYGPGTVVHPVTSAGRAGFFVRGASCGCHRENPILVTVVSRRERVSWLLVNGPGATRARAQALAAQMP